MITPEQKEILTAIREEINALNNAKNHKVHQLHETQRAYHNINLNDRVEYKGEIYAVAEISFFMDRVHISGYPKKKNSEFSKTKKYIGFDFIRLP